MTSEPLQAPTPPCLACNGNGTIVMSLCCGRGCATCPGDGMMRALVCERCGGTGQQAVTPATPARP